MVGQLNVAFGMIHYEICSTSEFSFFILNFNPLLLCPMDVVQYSLSQEECKAVILLK